MLRKRLVRLICAVSLMLGMGFFAYRAVAGVRDFASQNRAAKEEPRVLLQGERLFTVAGYELNASFTPGGEFFCFELRAVRAKAASDKLKA